jgi:hypothetical protein
MPTPPTTTAAPPTRSSPELDLLRLVEAVAVHLPGTWTITAPYSDRVFLAQSDTDLGFYLIAGTAPARISITASVAEIYPHLRQPPSRSITASAIRGGTHVAKEIVRRLLPGHQEDLAAAHAALARHADRLERYYGAHERVRELVPAADGWSTDIPDRTSFWQREGLQFTYRLRFDGTCGIEMDDLPEPVALEVIALLADRLDLTADPAA